MKKVLKKIFDIPLFYSLLRNVTTFGIRTKPVLSALDLRKGESLLDIGCGMGDYSRFVSQDGSYLGVDPDHKFIQKAKEHYGRPHVTFLCGEAEKMDLGNESFDKALLVFVAHHMDDQACESLLYNLSQVVKDRLIIVENIYVKNHFLNNYLCKVDRGAFIRSLDAQKRLYEKFFSVEEIRYYYTRSFIKKRILFVCKPKN